MRMTMFKIISLTPSSMPKEEIILGIDPGFGRVGWGVIKKDAKGEWRELGFGCIETSSKKSFVERISQIHEELIGLIKKHKPTRMAVEELFFFSNVKTAIEVGQAPRGVFVSGVGKKLPKNEIIPPQAK